MLTSIEYDAKQDKILARVINADAASGDVLPGRATTRQIRKYANANWACPYEYEGSSYGDYTTVKIVWLLS